MEIKNAIIKDTFLGIEDHGIFTCYIVVEGDGFGVNIGGYCLDDYDANLKKRVGIGKSIDIIKKILDVVGVGRWEKLKDKPIRIKCDGWGSEVSCIGNLIHDKWIDFKTDFN